MIINIILLDKVLKNGDTYLYIFCFNGCLSFKNALNFHSIFILSELSFLSIFILNPNQFNE